MGYLTSKIIEERNLDIKNRDKTNKFIINRKFNLLKKFSRAENHFKSLLINSNIRFTREKVQRTDNNLYYTDFYLKDYNINIEVDGKEHLKNIEYDKKKERKINSRDFSITLRYTNEYVLGLDNISVNDLFKEAKRKYVTNDGCTYQSALIYKRWKGKYHYDVRIKDERETEEDIHKQIIQESFENDDLTIFIKGKSIKENGNNIIELNYDIYEQENLIESIIEKSSPQLFMSGVKSEFHTATGALSRLIIEGQNECKITLFTSLKFFADRNRNLDNFPEYDCIYYDVLKQYLSVVKEFPYLDVKWIYGSVNLISKNN